MVSQTMIPMNKNRGFSGTDDSTLSKKWGLKEFGDADGTLAKLSSLGRTKEQK